MTIDITDNSGLAREEFETACLRALEKCGLAAEGYAKRLCPVGTPESTGIPGYQGGTLRNSITHQVASNEGVVYIGTNIKYAVYVECGTGKYSTTGGGTHKERWLYKDAFGNWHIGHPQRAQPYLKPAVVDHASQYRGIIESELRNG